MTQCMTQLSHYSELANPNKLATNYKIEDNYAHINLLPFTIAEFLLPRYIMIVSLLSNFH